MEAVVKDTIHVRSCLGPGDEHSLADDVLDGLTRPFKELAPKYFNDARGSKLFDAICELPEYYQARTERLILETAAEEIAACTGAVELVELGSGSATKTRVLLDAMAAAGTLERYVAVDISERTVLACADTLSAKYPGLRVHGLVGDFERHLGFRPRRAARAWLRFWAGRSATSRRAAAGGSCGAWPACSARTDTSCWEPTSSRTPRCSRPPTTTAQASRASSIATCCTCSTANLTRTSTSRRSLSRVRRERR